MSQQLADNGTIRQATEPDRDAVLEYLSREPEFNTFAIGDILRFGMETDFQQVFLETDAAGAPIGVMLRYRGSLLPYTHAVDRPLVRLASAVNRYLQNGAKWTMCGTDEIVEPLLPQLVRAPGLEDKHEYFAVCRKLADQAPPPMLGKVDIAGPEHASEITELFAHVPEFQHFSRNDAELAQELRDGIAKIVYIRDQEAGRMVSTATAAAETHLTGMIIGVATVRDERYRRRGYASACTYWLVRDLLARGKSACLFFDNPQAGSIYRRLGFVDFGQWRILMF